jgi:hypothetical protein
MAHRMILGDSMSNLPVATMTVDFKLPVSPQGLTIAVERVARKHAADYEYWSSIRTVNGKQYFRLGWKERTDTSMGLYGLKHHELSGDIVVVPGDGKNDEWFATGVRYERVCVRSRVCSPSLNEPLRYLDGAEQILNQIVAILGNEFRAEADEFTERTMTSA